MDSGKRYPLLVKWGITTVKRGITRGITCKMGGIIGLILINEAATVSN